MSNDPRDIMAAQVQPEAMADFLRERKRLREARIKWIDEHEMPQAMELKDGDGKTIYSGGPFQVGRMTYDEDYEKAAAGHKDAKKGILPEMSSEDQKAVTAQLDEVAEQYNQFSGITTRDRSGAEVSFSHKSDHPPIREGETHEEWFTRVSNAYSQAPEGSPDAGDSGAHLDGVRSAAGDDPSGEGSGHSDRAGDSGGTANAALDSGAVADDPSGSEHARRDVPDGTGDSTPTDAASETAAQRSVTRRLRSLFRNRKD